MSIFDSIVGSLSSFGDALSTDFNLKNGLKSTSYGNQIANASGEQGTNALYRSMLLESRLSMGRTEQPYPAYSFRAGQSQPAPTANPDEINQQWLQRLSRYSQMPTYEGGRAK